MKLGKEKVKRKVAIIQRQVRVAAIIPDQLLSTHTCPPNKRFCAPSRLENCARCAIKRICRVTST